MEFIALTDVGLIRPGNEDFVAADPQLGLVVVADGMGGHRGGAVASRMAVEGMVAQMRPRLCAPMDIEVLRRQLVAALEKTNGLIYDRARQDPSLRGMGTTVIAGVFRDAHLIYVWLGDSRLYRFREGRLTCLSRDHSLLQEMLDEGVVRSAAEALELGVGGNVLTRALGSEPWVDPGLGQVAVEAGDMFLFCTDGLSHLVEEAEIAATLADEARDLRDRAECLIEMACLCGGSDNVSVVLVG